MSQAERSPDICRDPSFRMIRGGGFAGFTYETNVVGGQTSFSLNHGDQEVGRLSVDHQEQLRGLCEEVVADGSLQSVYESRNSDDHIYGIEIAGKNFRVDEGALMPDILQRVIDLGNEIQQPLVRSLFDRHTPQSSQ